MQKTLKIAVIIKNFNLLGGAEKYAVKTTQLLALKGHKIDLYSWNADKKIIDGINHIKIPYKAKFSSFLSLWFFGYFVRKKLKNKKYDAIISHDRTWSQDISIVHTFSYKTGLKKYSFFRKIDQVWLSPRALCYLWLEKQQMSKKNLVSVSDIIKDDIKNNYQRVKNVFTITPGIDMKTFSHINIQKNKDKFRNKENIPDNKFIVLFVGSEFKRKGLDVLIPSIGDDMFLYIAGRGEKINYYKKLIKKYNKISKIKFLGLIKDTNKWYSISDVVVLPSIKEAFGMTILEAMSCGLPVIVSKNAGVSSLIDHGKNGFICQNQKDIETILLELKNTPKTRKRIGENARLTAFEHTWDICADKFEELCLKITEQKNKDYLSEESSNLISKKESIFFFFK